MDKSLIREKTKDLLEKVGEPKDFTKGLQELLQSYVNQEATKNYQRIIPETGKFYGVPKPVLRVIGAEIGKYLQKESITAESLLEVIWTEGSFEVRQITGMSLEKFGPKYSETCLKFISTVLTDLDNWSVCDILAMSGVEPIVYTNPNLVLPLSEKWIQSDHKWIRRFGVVSLRGYKKVKTTDKVFRILDSVMNDSDQDVKKGVAWVLREITKKNVEEVADFLLKWAQANPNKETRWIIKNGMTKLPEEKQTELLTTLNQQS